MSDIKKDIANATDKVYLTELDKYIDRDIENANNDVNKKVVMLMHGLSEVEYDKRKKVCLEYFADIKKRIREKLKTM